MLRLATEADQRDDIKEGIGRYLRVGDLTNVIVLPGSGHPSKLDLGLAAKWYSDCAQSNSSCAGVQNRPLPKTLIDVGGLTGQSPLTLAGTEGSNGIYVALSHC